jgi:hypothetical protein
MEAISTLPKKDGPTHFGIRKDQLERRAYHQGSLWRILVEIDLPVSVDETKTEASYQQGF